MFIRANQNCLHYAFRCLWISMAIFQAEAVRQKHELWFLLIFNIGIGVASSCFRIDLGPGHIFIDRFNLKCILLS